MPHEGLRKKFEEAGFRVSPRNDVDPGAVAWLLGITPRTLDNWRSQRKGPVYLRLGKRVWYPLGAIVDYLDERMGAVIARRTQ